MSFADVLGKNDSCEVLMGFCSTRKHNLPVALFIVIASAGADCLLRFEQSFLGGYFAR